MARPQRTYRLFTRCQMGNEPKVMISIDSDTAPTQSDDHKPGSKRLFVPRYGERRGAQIYVCHSYAALVKHAEYLATMMGLPKSRIWDIFDWNEGS